MLVLTPPDLQALMLSAKVALTATLVALPFGFAVACLLVFPRWPGRITSYNVCYTKLLRPSRSAADQKISPRIEDDG